MGGRYWILIPIVLQAFCIWQQWKSKHKMDGKPYGLCATLYAVNKGVHFLCIWTPIKRSGLAINSVSYNTVIPMAHVACNLILLTWWWWHCDPSGGKRGLAMYQHDCPQMMIWCDWTKSLPPILGFYAGQPSMEAWNQSDAVSTMPMQDPTQSHHTPYDPSWSILINAIKTVSQLQIKTTKAKCAATYLYNTSLHKFPYQKDSPHLQPKVKSAIDQEILRAPPPEPLNEPYFLDALQELIGNENSLLFMMPKIGWN